MATQATSGASQNSPMMTKISEKIAVFSTVRICESRIRSTSVCLAAASTVRPSTRSPGVIPLRSVARTTRLTRS